MTYCKLNDIATIYNGNSINKAEKQQKYMNDVPGWNYIGTKDVDFDGTITYKNGVIIPFSDSKFKIAPAGAVFVCSEGGSARRKTAIITEDVCFGNKLFAIVNSKKLFVEKYVYYYTRFGDFTKKFKLLASTLMGGISAKNFGSIEIPLPSIPEQQRIVTRIEKLFSELDKSVETLQTIKQQLAVYRQAVLNSFFVPQADWVSCDLGNVLDILTDYHANGSYETLKANVELLDEPDYAFMVRSTNFEKNDFSNNVKYINKHSYDFLKKSQLLGGEVLMGKIGNAGRIYYMKNLGVPMSLAMNMFAMRFNNHIDSKYAYYFLLSPKATRNIESHVKGVGTPTIDKKSVRSVHFCYPEIAHQREIIKGLESRLSVCDSIELTANSALAQADAMRQSILKQAFEGGLTE